ncbi:MULTISPECIES: DNA-binding protein [unclassified Mesorhizobium]|uniref:DNA-binding protein n=1 Tax=unclassified Mesorhizobium TaxID=325217 RepID=UPI0011282015|nr:MULTISPECIES: DNA-binding protein [unclassified Mesorhizobium]TPK42622.1 DNA-binding protein [Mesorhizobium sp. B2-5-2]TPL26742.1 DNA-binding protein [Mesorhizobium sp. B2-4-7]TPL40520.1 DNA-binding protein [Mesorhizobium sp. B2-4-5]TPM76794.1 DNA-binding protein [Mesorhizobium sp. B2-1-6]TPN72457.1 DNA-binding protein [Mesorhizobium sp. B1-1-2]
MKVATSDAIDLVWGAAAIGKEIKQKPRQAFHMLEAGLLPARKVGNRWVADRGKLRKFFLETIGDIA